MENLTPRDDIIHSDSTHHLNESTTDLKLDYVLDIATRTSITNIIKDYWD